MVGWHDQLNGRELEQALGNGEGQRSLACCSPWGRKESDTTEQLNNNKPHQWWARGMGGITQPMEALNRTKMQRKGESAVSLSRDIHLLFPSDTDPTDSQNFLHQPRILRPYTISSPG